MIYSLGKIDIDTDSYLFHVLINGRGCQLMVDEK
jgi:hypothetical protein